VLLLVTCRVRRSKERDASAPGAEGRSLVRPYAVPPAPVLRFRSLSEDRILLIGLAVGGGTATVCGTCAPAIATGAAAALLSTSFRDL